MKGITGIENKIMDPKIKKYQGGFPDSIMEHPEVVDQIMSGRADNGGGWLGRHYVRNHNRDRNLYDKLTHPRELNMDEDFAALFIVSRFGRWYGDYFDTVSDDTGFHPKGFCAVIGEMVFHGKDYGVSINFNPDEVKHG